MILRGVIAQHVAVRMRVDSLSSNNTGHICNN